MIGRLRGELAEIGVFVVDARRTTRAQARIRAQSLSRRCAPIETRSFPTPRFVLHNESFELPASARWQAARAVSIAHKVESPFARHEIETVPRGRRGKGGEIAVAVVVHLAKIGRAHV